MVADQPLDQVTPGLRGRLPGRGGRGRAGRRWPGSTPSRAAASSCATSPAAGGSTPARSSPPVVEAFVLDGQQARLTQAALETLAVVAYKQPVSRARVSAIRGVNVDGVMRTLLTRGLVEEAGQDGETGANLYRTTQLLPRADRRHLARRAARARAVPARHGRHRGRAGRMRRARRSVGADPEPARADPRRRRSPPAGRAPRPAQRRRHRARRRDRDFVTDRARRRGPDPAAEAARPVRGRLPPQVRGADARRAGSRSTARSSPGSAPRSTRAPR